MSARALSVTYSTRERVAAIPFGGALPRHVEYVEVDGPEGTIVDRVGQLWIKSTHGGSLTRVDPLSGSVAGVDLRAAAPRAWQGRDLSVVALGDGGSAVAALVASEGDRRMEFALVRFSAEGAVMSVDPWPDMDRARQLPEALTVDGAGRVWVHFLGDTWLMSPDGARLRAIGAPGVLSSEGFFVTSEASPALFDAEGKLVGPVERFPASLGRLRLAGPFGVIFASAEADTLPSALASSLVVLDVLVLDPLRRTLSLEDRIVWPELVRAAPADPIGDACDVESEFMPRSLACDAEGTLWILEHAPPTCLFHRHQILARRELAPRKFAAPRDLSPAEIALLRAEARARAGAVASPEFAPFFAPTTWAETARAGGEGPDFTEAIEQIDAASPQRP